MPPLISIITVVYNSAELLEATISSVECLNYERIEYIVIDGGSTDQTLEVVRKYSDKKVITKWISEKDSGIYEAMNKGITLAKGDWINFMNAGDRFSKSTSLNFFTSLAEEYDIIYGNAEIVTGNTRRRFPIHPIKKIWKYSPFCHQASFSRSSVMKYYQFNTEFRIGADHDFFFRAFIDGRKFHFVNEIICLFDGSDGTTKRRIFEAISDKMNIALKYQPSIYKWLYYKIFLGYIVINRSIKKFVGPKLTAKLLKALRGGHA